MMEATNWHGVFVADFAAERARLRKAKVMCFGRVRPHTTQGRALHICSVPCRAGESAAECYVMRVALVSWWASSIGSAQASLRFPFRLA